MITRILKIVFLFLTFTFTSQAQWWVDGGNILYPWGDVSITGGDLTVTGITNLDSTLIVDSLSVTGGASIGGLGYFGDDLHIDPQGVESYDATLVYPNLVLTTSKHDWWGTAEFRNYWNSGYVSETHSTAHSVVLSNKQIFTGSGVINGDEVVNNNNEIKLGDTDMHADSTFDGTFGVGQVFIGTKNVFSTKFGANISDNPYAIYLYDSYFKGFAGGTGDTLSFTDGYFGYNFRGFVTNSDVKYTGEGASFHSDLSAAANWLVTPTVFYHFLTEGDYPSYFGGDIQSQGAYNFATDTSTAAQPDIYDLVYSPFVSYSASTVAAGTQISWIATTENTGAANILLNALAQKDLLKMHDQELAAGDIEVGQVVTAIYDGTAWQMTSQIAQ